MSNLLTSRYSLRNIKTTLAAVCIGLLAIAGCLNSNAPTEGNATDSTPGSTTNEEMTAKAHGEQAETIDFHPKLKDRKYDAAIRDVAVREDPVVDGWESETFSEQAAKQLKILGAMLQTGDTSQLNKICSVKFTCSDLRPATLALVYEGPLFTVNRAQQADEKIDQHQGRTGLEESIQRQFELFPQAFESHFKYKIYRARLSGRTAATLAYFQMSGKGNGQKHVQVNATWQCNWILNADEAPKLTAILVKDYEEVVSTDRVQSAFSDCTKSAFSGVSALEEQLIYGRDHWYSNLESTIGVEGRGNGIAIGDVNGDGLDDIYFCQPAALPNRLFVRNADGSMSDVSKTAKVDWLDSSRGALFVDIDNDGDQDLVLAQSTTVLIHENDGTGVFEVREELVTNSKLFSINAVDYDSDGLLDLYVCGYTSAEQDRPEDIFASPVPYHDANNGGPSFLWRNKGDWKFADVTKESGLDANNLRFSLASVWEDFDNDGDLDVYVANDFGRNSLYRNDAGKFTDVAADAGVEDIGPGMSAAWGDANNDGLMDLYVSNMFSSAGSRITHQSKFKRGSNGDSLKGFRRHARGNSLFINRGDGTFADRATQSATGMGRWAWGSLFVDLNNDGWRDLYVTNGFVTADNNNDL